ncbi:hypothetical protein RQP46_002345 [Phenoliferia psychrophenolica]
MQEDHEVRFGDSFVSPSSAASFLSVRYSAKPSSLDDSRPGTLSGSATSSTALFTSFPSKTEGGDHWFSGSIAPAKEVDCVLLWDEATQSYTLERLESTVKLSHERAPKGTVLHEHASLPGSPRLVPTAAARLPRPQQPTAPPASDTSSEEELFVPSVPPKHLRKPASDRAREVVNTLLNAESSSTSGDERGRATSTQRVTSSKAASVEVEDFGDVALVPQPAAAAAKGKGKDRASRLPSVPRVPPPAKPHPAAASKRPAPPPPQPPPAAVASKRPAPPRSRPNAASKKPAAPPTESTRPRRSSVALKSMPASVAARQPSSGSDESGSDDSSDDDDDEEEESGPEGYLAVPGKVFSRSARVDDEDEDQDAEGDDESESEVEMEELESTINAGLRNGAAAATASKRRTGGAVASKGLSSRPVAASKMPARAQQGQRASKGPAASQGRVAAKGPAGGVASKGPAKSSPVAGGKGGKNQGAMSLSRMMDNPQRKREADDDVPDSSEED